VAVARAFGTVAVVLVLALVAGCSTPPPATHIGEFAAATEDLAQQATLAYAQIDELTVERKIVSVASVPGELPDDGTFQGVLSDEQKQVRMVLLDLLGEYAAALGELANAEVGSDVDRAATDLYGSLGRLKSSFATATGRTLPLSDDSIALIATAIDAIGAQIVESKRRSAIKTIVMETNPAIQNVTALLSKELPSLGPIAEVNISTVEADMIVAYGKEASKLQFGQRVDQIEKIRRINQGKLAARGFFSAVGAAAHQVGATHQTLFEAVSQDRFTTRALVVQISELATFAKSIKAFHKKLVAT
jgi:hypothetical protein